MRCRVGIHAAVAVAALTLVACGRNDASKAATTAAAPQANAAAPVQAKPLPVPPPAVYLRDHYTRLEDCVFDWGYAAKCLPVEPGSVDHAKGVAFYGPTYSSTLRLESQLASRKEAFERGYLTQFDETPSDRSSAKSEVKA